LYKRSIFYEDFYHSLPFYVTCRHLQAQEVTEIKPEQFQEVMNEFVNRYNDREYDKMVAGFSPEMLEELPLEKTADLFGEMFTNYGEILKVEPPVFKEGNQAIFGVRCDRGIFKY
jgi:hypothetical protein